MYSIQEGVGVTIELAVSELLHCGFFKCTFFLAFIKLGL